MRGGEIQQDLTQYLRDASGPSVYNLGYNKTVNCANSFYSLGV